MGNSFLAVVIKEEKGKLMNVKCKSVKSGPLLWTSCDELACLEDPLFKEKLQCRHPLLRLVCMKRTSTEPLRAQSGKITFTCELGSLISYF